VIQKEPQIRTARVLQLGDYVFGSKKGSMRAIGTAALRGRGQFQRIFVQHPTMYSDFAGGVDSGKE
jgi:hypothetical protein